MTIVQRKRNKRSLKKRILKMMSLINFSSLLMMLISLMILFGVTVNILGKAVSENIAKQMRGEVELYFKDRRIDDDIDKLNPRDKKIFWILGERYRIYNREDRFWDDIENLSNDLTSSDKDAFENILLVDYKILKDNEVVYSSLSDNTLYKDVYDEIELSGMLKFINKEIEEPIFIQGNTDETVLKVRLNPILVVGGYISIASIGVIIFFITHFIAQMLARTFSGLTVKPLVDLEARLERLAEGNIQAAMSSEIVLKRPIREVENLATSTNKIISKMCEYVSLLESHKAELEAQNCALEENSATLTLMNTNIESKHSKLKNILNHVEQGFLTFGKSLYIDDEYSLECERIFGENISRSKFSHLIYPNDKNLQKFIDDLVTKIFSSSRSQRSLYLSLLPEEVLIKGKNINITYKVVTNESHEEILMIILNDITEKRKLERRMDEERNTLKMVVKAIINRNEFIQLVNEYKHFTEEDFKNLENSEFDDVLRNVHNFKGNFSQFDMVTIVRKLDEIENRLYENSEDFNASNLDGSELLSWVNEDIEIIEAYAGKEFLEEEEMFYIKKSKLLEIEDKLRRVLSSQECKTVLPIIKSLGYKSIKDLLRNYPAYVQKLSERLSKPVNQMEITGDDVLIDTNFYKELSKVLVHIFRNCVDHGIENEDERLEKGKEQLGTITCNIEEDNENFRIIISDDGKGIDIEALERKSIELGFYSAGQISEMSHQQKLNLIFEQGISTKETATTISGRGVGMASVRKCVQDIGGNIEVESEKNIYTKFIITVPKIQNEASNLVTVDEFMEAMLRTTGDIILDQTGLCMNQGELKEKNIIELNKVTSLISLKGSINSIIMISANEPMAIKLVEGFMLEELDEEEKYKYAEDVLGEVCNNILGNTLGLFDEGYNIFHMGIPAMISNNGAYVKYTDSNILNISLECEKYKISISMIELENENIFDEKGDIVWQEY